LTHARKDLVKMKKLEIIKKKSIGIRDGYAFVTPGGIALVTTPVFEKSKDADAFKEYRRANMTLGEAARRLGLTVLQTSGLEHGEYDCDWEIAVAMLEEPNVG
jgi:hypothetical protein